jgi:aminoglycoside phosphotransferase family enzyme/predicted kinase
MTIPPEQQDAADYLAELAGAGPSETHISAVFIGTDTVWKLKKAVRLPFLDFTSLDAREHFLRRELELNQPAAPAIYRDVIAISRDAKGSVQTGGDNPIDWVLRMTPIPKDDFLNIIASRGELTPKRLDDLADAVAAYHALLPPVLNWDSAQALLRISEGNALSALSAGLPQDAVTAWHQQITAAIEHHRSWLDQRAATGFVRRCHGDLHLGNLCLWDDKPVPFDALEFDEALATIDVAYDIAFLLMDLEHRAGRRAANHVLNRYVARTGDIATAGLPMFLSQRAMIRAHVLQATQQDGSAYFAAAQRYLTPPKPIMVAIGGLQGTGKSTLARTLAPDLGLAPGALVVRSDEIRKRLHGVLPEARLPPDAYTTAANEATNDTLIEHCRTAAASGHAVIADATFLDENIRHRLRAAALQAGLPFLGVWLQAPLSVLEQRIGARTADASDATISVLHRSVQNDPGPGDWLAVDADNGALALEIIRRSVEAATGRPVAGSG